jgi:hypothetical protein
LLRGQVPVAVAVAAGFFALAGALEVVLSLVSGTPSLGKVWEALGRAFFDGVLALGLWHRLSLARTAAMVYCLAAILTYAAVLLLAYAEAPFLFPDAIVVQSLFEVPSCALLYPYLRSPRASLLFARSLFDRHAARAPLAPPGTKGA